MSLYIGFSQYRLSNSTSAHSLAEAWRYFFSWVLAGGFPPRSPPSGIERGTVSKNGLNFSPSFINISLYSPHYHHGDAAIIPLPSPPASAQKRNTLPPSAFLQRGVTVPLLRAPKRFSSPAGWTFSGNASARFYPRVRLIRLS